MSYRGLPLGYRRLRVSYRSLPVSYRLFHTQTIAEDRLADKGKVWGHLVPENRRGCSEPVQCSNQPNLRFLLT